MTSSRRERVYQKFPDIVSGYELNPDYGYFSVIIPEATTNLITNPSVEAGSTTNYIAVGGAMAAVATWQAYGAYGLQLTPAVSTESGFYFGDTGPIALAAGTTYTASVTIQGEEGKIYYIWIGSTAGALIGTKRAWIGTGRKQRIWVTTWEPTGASRRVYVTRDARYTDQNKFYADGLQLEAKDHPTTFCDGDQVGFLVNETPAPYLWTGTPRASASTRSAQTRSGGREMSLLSLGIKVLAIVGLGMAPLVDQSLPIPGYGEMAQGTGTSAREFTLVSAVYADGQNGRHLQAIRSDLVDAFKPDLTVVDQPLILRYQAVDDEGDVIGDCLDIICKYRTGLEGNWDNHQQERVALQFKMYMPYIQASYDSGVALGYQTSIATVGGILQRGSDGIWGKLSNGHTFTVWDIKRGKDNSIYVGGSFSSMDGVANANGITKWNGTAFSAMGLGMTLGGAGEAVRSMQITASGNVYAVGNYTQAAGVANTNGIAMWDGAAWNAVGNNTNFNSNVWTSAIDPFGHLYVGGAFADGGTIATADGVAMWNGITWAGLGSGLAAGGTALAMAMSPDGLSLYVAGTFASAGGVANTLNIAKWSIINGTWSALGTGINGQVNTLYTDANGDLYAGGAFTLAGGVAGTTYLARWNGTAWSPITSQPPNNPVYYIGAAPDNNIIISGTFTSIGGISPPDDFIIYNRSNFQPLDIDLPGASIIVSALVANNTFYIGFSDGGTAISATVITPNIGSSKVYPKVIFTGSGVLTQLKNYTTGKSIFFNLTLLPLETAVLDLNPNHISFTSSWRGNILSTILKGSDLDFFLAPGANNISTYYSSGTGAGSAIVMIWNEQYWSIDGAILK
jgi:hypothetical protein